MENKGVIFYGLVVTRTHVCTYTRTHAYTISPCMFGAGDAYVHVHAHARTYAITLGVIILS